MTYPIHVIQCGLNRLVSGLVQKINPAKRPVYRQLSITWMRRRHRHLVWMGNANTPRPENGLAVTVALGGTTASVQKYHIRKPH